MKTFLAWVACSFVTASAWGAELSLAWPQFRGPEGSGVADHEKPPVEIGPNKNVKWKVSTPGGLSSPIVAGDKLVLTAFENGKLLTIAFHRADGKEAWRADAGVQQLEAYHKKEGSPASSTPATDGQRVVSYFGSCGLRCYDLEGKELWRYEMSPVDLPGEFGSGVSPILSEGLVILVRDQKKNSRIYAVDLKTGKLKWETGRRSPVSYCTPIVWDTPNGKQIVAAGHARMLAYDLHTGSERWSVDQVPAGCCTSPVVAEGLLFFAGSSGGGAEDAEQQVPSFDSMLKDLDKDKDEKLSRAEAEKAFEGFFDNQDANKDGMITRDEWDSIMKMMAEGNNAAFALKAGGTGDVTQSHIVWKQTKGLPFVPTAIVYRGQLLMVKDGGIVTAYDTTTGNQIFQSRVAGTGTYYASPVAANGNVYFTSLEGEITVIKAGTDKAEVVARNPKLEERTAATPAIADNTLYVRTEKHLYAFEN